MVCVLVTVAISTAVSSDSSSDLLPEDTAYKMIVEYMDYYPHPKLPYAYDALEPFIDAATLQVHHQGHHRAYCAKMNAALKEWREQVSGILFSAHQKGAGLVHYTCTVSLRSSY